MKKNIKLILVIIWMIIIFIFSSFSGSESAMQSNFIVNIIYKLFNINNISLLGLSIRKIAHFTEYLILGVLLINYFDLRKWYFSLIIAIIYAVSDEVHQLFVLDRVFAFTDIIIDSLGAIVGIIMYKYLTKSKK